MTMKRLLTIALFAVVACVGCPPPGPPEPPGPPPGPHPKGSTCKDVCDRYDELGCPEGEDTPDGKTCEAVCENVQASGIISWNLDCRAVITACDQVDSCDS